MTNALQFFIDGAWVAPLSSRTLPVLDPSTEEAFAEIAMGGAADIDRAVAAARRAFPAFAASAPAERQALLRRILAAYMRRYDEMAEVISREMGAPLAMSHASQAAMGKLHLEKMIEVLDTFRFEEAQGTTRILREAIGVVGLITPWNWPINQIACKVAPAIAAGCTMVLKPSEIAPLDAILFAEIMEEARTPPGVFNLVNGDGPEAGAALSVHPEVDMISFTGSTRAGIQIAKASADTIKRVHQELGGKSANILLADADFETAVTKGANSCFGNSGQSCNAPTRMLVPRDRHDEAAAIAARAASAHVVGPADAEGTTMGPVVSEVQFDKIQALIETALREGATLAAGGPGRPENCNRGWFVRPTVFSHVDPSMTIAREEIFGPVLSIIPYDGEEEAVRIANDTVYGLASYVQSSDLERARSIARRMRSGNVYINHPAWDAGAPFGGYKQSGNGREYGEWGLAEFLEIKGVVGYGA
ncbi:aldehyde dehydrogenase family protein [Aureimonas sp. ME7]|uniref:aldehyde dehydrogenase family protein n=1 Tax=Aureimonas sp. ME7 TaxID=2744252 RepID=UPI0015F77D8D|nr:aldehyde dehydrogenase family protein [Aureimonas sp. ME7]